MQENNFEFTIQKEKMGCEESQLSRLTEPLLLAVIDPHFLKADLKPVHDSLSQNNVHPQIFLSVPLFVQDRLSEDARHVVVRQQDLPQLQKLTKEQGLNPTIFVMTTPATPIDGTEDLVPFQEYSELLQLIESNAHPAPKVNMNKKGGQKKLKADRPKVDIKLLKMFEEQSQAQLFIFEETLKVKKISYLSYNSLEELEASEEKVHGRYVVADYDHHREAVKATEGSGCRVICFCNFQEKNFHPKVYSFTNNLQEIISEVQWLQSQKLAPLPVRKVYVCSQDTGFLKYAAVLNLFNFEIKHSQSIIEILRTTRLYFSVVVVCPQQEKSILQKTLENEGAVHRVKLLGIEEGTDTTPVALRRVLLELRRGYRLKVSLTSTVDIIDKNHSQTKFAEIKEDLTKNDIEYHCYETLKEYHNKCKFMSPFVICSHAERLGVANYIRDIQAKCKVIIYGSKAHLNNEEIMRDTRWILASHQFKKIIKFLKRSPVLMADVEATKQTKISHQHQQNKMQQHRMSVVKWANPNSNNAIATKPKPPFVSIKEDASSLELTEIYHEVATLLAIKPSPSQDLSGFKKRLQESLMYISDHHPVDLSSNGYSLESLESMTLKELAWMARKYLGDKKEVGMRLNDALRGVEKLGEQELKHWRQIVFLLNLNYLGFYEIPRITRRKLVHWTSEEAFEQCLPDETIIMKQYMVMYEQGSTVPPPNCMRVDMQIEYNTLTDSDPTIQHFFIHEGRYIFPPFTCYKVTKVAQQNDKTHLTLTLLPRTDFMAYYFSDNLASSLAGHFQKEVQAEESQWIGKDKNQVTQNMMRIQAIKTSRAGQYKDAISLQKALLEKEQHNENFDSNYLTELEFQMAHYYLKQGSVDQVLSLLQQIIHNCDNPVIKEQSTALLSTIMQQHDKENQPEPTQKARNKQCIDLQEAINNEAEEKEEELASAESEEEGLMRQEEQAILERDMQCLEIDDEGFEMVEA